MTSYIHSYSRFYHNESCPYNSAVKIENFVGKCRDIVKIIALQNKDCGYMLETAPAVLTSTQHSMFWIKIKENRHAPVNPKLGYKAVYFSWT